MEHKALGKGLSALIPDTKKSSENPTEISFIKTSQVREHKFQPRINYHEEKLSELISSIKESGVLQPILVRKKGDDFEVVAGERRLRAARALKIEEIPVIVKEMSDQEALVVALVENIQREDLNAIEEAKAYRRLIEEFNFTQEDIAQSVGKDKSTVSNLLRLLKLPADIQQAVVNGQMSMGHARAIINISDSQVQQEMFKKIIDKKLSVREIENLIKTNIRGSQKKRKLRSANENAELAFIEEELQQILGSKVRLQAQKKRGKIIIEYYSYNDLDRIIRIIKRK